MNFKKQYPNRMFDVGIAEEHAVSMAAGLAKQGVKPVVAIYSTFLQRSYDMILQDICMQKLHVVLGVDRAGLVGEDGETHHGVFDVGFLRQAPSMAILCPASCAELNDMMRWAGVSIEMLEEEIEDIMLSNFEEKIDYIQLLEEIGEEE